ncbi:MAG TPA: HAD-IIA family hydrolase [Candidatus Limnocylindrales bacterium]|nr:HAD-IIA family hydrolase [Candidatus Limnocylindrales bacterium]
MAAPSAPAPAGDLATALRGVRAFVLDADGVLMFRGGPIPGSVAAMETLRRRAIPYRVVTNYSTTHRDTLAAIFSKATGLPAEPERIITAASAAAAYTRRHHPGGGLYVLASADALREWDGQRVVTPDEADDDATPVDAVVIGDGGDALSFRNLDIAFRRLRAGAEFLAMHRNPWWLTRRGPTLDAGSVVAGLEFAVGRRALVCGKPSPVVFREAVTELRRDVAAAGGPALALREIAMVGDDPSADVAAARRVGLRGFLVLTGKTDEAEAAAAARRRVGRDGLAGSLAEIVSALA